MSKSLILLFTVLAVSVGFNIYFGFSGNGSYLESPYQIYVMESGILKNNLEFKEGQYTDFTYDFDNEEYPELLSKYNIDIIAGKGSEFQKALNLMNEFAPRLYHKSNYDNSVEMNAISLLEYSLGNRKQGINCRSKAQILNEMCLALKIYSRKVWIMPYSSYDNDCHVINEIWDSELNKWIMLDITNNEYWVDENGNPLSILEIRKKGALREFCTPVKPDDSIKDLKTLKQKYTSDFLYIMKNLVYTEYCKNYTVGENNYCILFPENMNTDFSFVISESSCIKAPY